MRIQTARLSSRITVYHVRDSMTQMAAWTTEAADEDGSSILEKALAEAQTMELMQSWMTTLYIPQYSRVSQAHIPAKQARTVRQIL